MNPESHPWKKMAAVARRSVQTDAGPVPSADRAAISWLPDLPEKVHSMFLRVIWKRWSIAAILLSAGLLGACLFASRGIFPEANDANLPRIPIPSAP